jgi:hypothetical protein
MEKPMQTKIGLWIDHKQAILVSLSDTGQEARVIISKVEKQLRRSGDSPLKGRSEPEKAPMSDNRQRAFTGHLNHYYDTVIAALRDAEAILILGPGEAKGELKKRLVRAKLGKQIVGVETADKMSGPQLAKEVRRRFQK